MIDHSHTPLITYYGGKQRLAGQLLGFLSPHTVYAEPFAGGLALLYKKGLPPVGGRSVHYREAVNDINDLLITLYRVGQGQPEDLLAMVEATLYSKSDHAKAQAICRDPAGHDQLTVAWAVYVTSMISFANIWTGGYGRGVLGRNLAATWANKVDSLGQRLDRLRDLHIDSVDALDFIDSWDSPHTVFFCDPPYPETDQAYYSDHYSVADLQGLVDKLASCQASFVLTCYAQPDVVFPDDWQQNELQTIMTAANGKHRGDMARTEVVWWMDRSQGSRDDVRPMLWQKADWGWHQPYKDGTQLSLLPSLFNSVTNAD